MTRAALSPLAWLDRVAERRRAANLRRSLRTRGPVGTELDLARNDYLGLTDHPEVIAGAVDAVRTWGAGSTGSRLVTGNTELHERFETELARFVGAESALAFSSGYTANIGAVVALTGTDCLLVSDELNHASLVDAARLSKSRVQINPHRDTAAVEKILAARDEERAVVVTESVFSTDGVLAPLRELHSACRRHGALLLVDEAHGLGVRGAGGQGLVHELGLAGEPDIVVTATMSKALGSQGGVVLGPAAVRAHLIDAARTFIFDTGLAPASVGAALAALGVLERHPELAAAVLDNVVLLLPSLLVYGAGTATNLQARYAGTDLAHADRRATAVSVAMVSTTIGAVAGPNLVGPLGSFARSVGAPALAGPFMLGAVAYASAGTVLFLLLRPDPFLVSRSLVDSERSVSRAVRELARIEGERSSVILDGELFQADEGRPIVLTSTAPVPFLRLAS